MWKPTVLLSGACLALAACASAPEDVTAQYVSPMTYQDYECDDIAEELGRVRGEVTLLVGSQEDAATRDAVVTGVGVVLFWPALFFLAAGDDSDELGRLKGEQEALETAAIQKNCPYAPEIIALQEERKKEAERRAEEKRKASAAGYEGPDNSRGY